MHPPGRPTSLPQVHTREFEGPLDLLLDEVRRQNVDIEKIAMAPIVSRFLDYMETAAECNLKLDMDWLHMAATLIHWKSRLLLPAEPAGMGERDPIRESLVQQLLAHRKQWGEELGNLRSREQGRISRFVCGVVEPTSESPDPPLICVWDMIQQARELARWVEKHREEVTQRQSLRVERDDVTVSEMTEYLRKQVSGGEGGTVDGGRLLLKQPSPARRACLFLGMLEMAQTQQLQLEQQEAFGPLWLSVP